MRWTFKVALYEIVLCLCLVISDSSKHVTHEQAAEECTNHGGLINSSYFKPIPETVAYPSIFDPAVKNYNDIDGVDIKEGESVWVSGFAMYGLPVTWHSFTQVHVDGLNGTLDGNSIFRGLHHCWHNQKFKDPFIGINSKYCICLKFADINAMKRDTRSDDKGTLETVSIYRIVEARALKNKLQCDYIERHENGTHERSSKCSEYKQFICVDKATEKLSLECATQFTSVANARSNCLVTKRKTWSESSLFCDQFSGKLLSFHEKWTGDIPLTNDNAYWVGTFRSFVSTQSPETSGSPCLVVTRLGITLVLEPFHCNYKLKFLCADNLIQQNNSKAYLITFGCVLIVVCIVLVTFLGVRRFRKGIPMQRFRDEVSRQALVLEMETVQETQYYVETGPRYTSIPVHSDVENDNRGMQELSKGAAGKNDHIPQTSHPDEYDKVGDYKPGHDANGIKPAANVYSHILTHGSLSGDTGDHMSHRTNNSALTNKFDTLHVELKDST